METQEGYLATNEVNFYVSGKNNEPNVISFVFENWEMATAYYSLLQEGFGNYELYAEFIKETPQEMEINFKRISNNEWITGASVKYKEPEFKQFTKAVKNTDRYVVLFGFVDKGQFITASHPGIEFSPIVFLGYTT